MVAGEAIEVQPLEAEVVERLVPECRPEAARLDDHDLHARPGDLDAERLRECLERVLRRLIPPGERRRRPPEDRRDVHGWRTRAASLSGALLVDAPGARLPPAGGRVK